MVSILQVIDNPHQDIPLAAVLLGPMFSLTEDELAIIRMENRTADLYDAILTYDKSDALYARNCSTFWRCFRILERRRPTQLSGKLCRIFMTAQEFMRRSA